MGQNYQDRTHPQLRTARKFVNLGPWKHLLPIIAHEQYLKSLVKPLFTIASCLKMFVFQLTSSSESSRQNISTATRLSETYQTSSTKQIPAVHVSIGQMNKKSILLIEIFQFIPFKDAKFILVMHWNPLLFIQETQCKFFANFTWK